MPSTLLLKFTDLLTESGLQTLSDQVNQLLQNPALHAELDLSPFTLPGGGEVLRIPVSVAESGDHFTMEWQPPGVGEVPDLDMNLGQVAAVLRDVLIEVDRVKKELISLQVAFDTAISAFRDAMEDQLAKIPFKVSTEVVGDVRQFRFSQDLEKDPPQVSFAGHTATLTNSSVVLSQAGISSFMAEGDVLFPGLTLPDGSGPYITSLHFSGTQGNLLTVTAENLPLATMQGFQASIDQLHLEIQGGQVQAGSSVNGRVLFPFLEQDAAGVPELQLSVLYGEDGKITWTALNPEGKGFRKGGITVAFDVISVETQPGTPPNITINGTLLLEGIEAQNGEPLATPFTMVYDGNTYHFTGSNITPIPLPFGTITLEEVVLVIQAGSGDLLQSDWTGEISIPLFDQGSLGFIITYQSEHKRFTLFAANQENIPLQYGDFSVLLKPLTLTFEEGTLLSVTGNGSLELPLFGSEEPILIELNYELAGDHPTLRIGAMQLPAPEVAGCTMKFEEIGFLFINNVFIEATLKGNITFPEVTGDDGIGFKAEIEDNGHIVRFELDDDSAPHRIDLNITQLLFHQFSLVINRNALETFSGEGTLTLPVFDDRSLDFLLEYDTTESTRKVVIESEETLTTGPLTINRVYLLHERTGEGTTRYSGEATLLIEGFGTQSIELVVTSENGSLVFQSENPVQLELDDFELHIEQAGFTLGTNETTGSRELSDLNFNGFMRLPACVEGQNTLQFRFVMEQSGNSYTLELNQGSEPTTLDFDGARLSLHTFVLSIQEGQIHGLSSEATLEVDGLGAGDSGEPASITVGLNRDADTGIYNISLLNPEEETTDLKLGGFTLHLSTLEVNFRPNALQYPFVFAGALVIPGLKDAEGNDASLGITLDLNEGGEFSAKTTSDAVFRLGDMVISQLEVSIEREGGELTVKLEGLLSLETAGSNSKGLNVTIEVESDGSFLINGSTEEALKVLDIPSAVRLYLNMVELSYHEGSWGFAMGGVVHNLVVIPGMDQLLPDQILLRRLGMSESLELDMRLSWPSGLAVEIGSGNSNEVVRIPVNGRFGNAITLDAMNIEYGDFSAPTIPLNIAFTGAVISLGPVAASVDGLGATLEITKANNPAVAPGNFGVVNIETTFRRPTGLGVALDTPLFTGGGYLSYNELKEEYAGAVELSFKELFHIAAIGVINNRMPDGQPGTSVLFIMSVQFPTPGITLGFGFFLGGMGGIIGIHRTIHTDKLRDGIRQGTIQNVLFPTNIVQNIPAIVSDIQEVFPIKRDQFIIGPMARITWGVPTIMRIDLGLAIEFANPVRFAILGVLKVALPTEELSLIKLNVAFLGMIDFENKMLSFDAAIFDSRILTFGLQGHMALRLAWGEPKEFLLSMGGFHPAYSPPPSLMIPTMDRLTVNILTGNPRLRLYSYFAITTNTVQFGAALDFLFKVSKFRVVGEFGFDVLFRFSPFRFIASANARLAVKAGSSSLLSISLDFTLEGPTPWRAKGKARFRVLFIKIKVSFDKTWGDTHNTTLESIEVFPLVSSAFKDPMNWRSIPRSNSDQGVRLKSLQGDNGLLLTPNGSIEVTQKVVPLDAPVERFGQYEPKDYTKYVVSSPRVGSLNAASDPLTEFFAPADFLDLEESEKLSLPSFEKQMSGIRIGASDDMKVAAGRNRIVRYQKILSDIDYLSTPDPGIMQPLPHNGAAFLMTHGAMARSPFSNRRKLLVNKHKTKVKQPEYVLVTTDNLEQVGTTVYPGYMQARAAMREMEGDVRIVTTDTLNKD